jgi:hypothetical protein
MVVDQLIGQADAIRTRAQHLVCDLIPDQAKRHRKSDSLVYVESPKSENDKD